MAESEQSKSEAPTPKRREDARKQGQVALSSELTTGILLLAGVFVLSRTAPRMGSRLGLLFAEHLRQFGYRSWTPEDTVHVSAELLGVSLHIVGFLLAGSLIGGIVANLLQIGFRMSGSSLEIKWSRFSPANGVTRLFSRRTVVRATLGLIKLVAVLTVVGGTLYAIGPEALGADRTSAMRVVVTGWQSVIFAAFVGTGVLLVLGVLDFAFQRWQHEQDLRMSRREVQEEHKQTEGDPLVKSRLRKLQRDATNQRMLKEVPDASVVLTNPTHLAVAVKYERGSMQAPCVVAKGEGRWAKRIAQIARENDIPVLERKPLARALFAAVEVGQEIPVALYQAMAEILAYVYQLRNR